MRRYRLLAALVAVLFVLTSCSSSAGEGTGDTSPPAVETTTPSDGSTGPDSTGAFEDGGPRSDGPESRVGVLEFTDAEVAASEPPIDLHPDAGFTVTVTLKEGVEWSDGTPLTAADFAGGYEVLWAQQWPIWESLVSVDVVDDRTLVFQTRDMSENILRDLIRWNQTTSTSQYGDFYEQLRALRESGADPASDEVASVLADLDGYLPDETVAYGPFVVDPDTVTSQQLVMSKNPRGYNADVIGFEEVIVYWGTTAQTVPLILSDQLDYSTDPLTPADEQAIASKENYIPIRTPLSVGTGIWFNESIPPFDQVEFRQAVASIIDRQRNASVALGESAKPIVHMAGFSDNLVIDWLDEGTREALDLYPLDHDRASRLLESIGFSRTDRGWVDADGEPVTFEITAPTEFTDFLASARDVSEQLNEFGFNTTVRGIPAASRPEIIPQADYTVMLDFSLISTPNHPHSSLNWNLGFGFWGNNNPEAEEGASKGMNYPWTQLTSDGQEVYIPDLLEASIAGMDKEAQREPVRILAEIFNRDLPVVPLYERYTNDPAAHGPRVEGWLPPDHGVYANNQGSDNYASIQFLEGTLQPMEGSDGTFRTSATYTQPPNLSYNFYRADSLYGSFSSPAYDVSFPPLFWYSESEGFYFPSVAESYSLYEVGG